MKLYRINHFEDKGGERVLVHNLVLKAKSAFRALNLYLQPEDLIKGFYCTNNYGEYRNGNTLVRVVAAHN